MERWNSKNPASNRSLDFLKKEEQYFNKLLLLALSMQTMVFSNKVKLKVI